jgi:lysophospholipase L1-like esterase
VSSNSADSAGGARWIALGLSTLLALALAEVGARAFGLAPATKSLGLGADHSVYQRSTNPILGFELKAGYRNDAPDYTTSYPFTNAHGQRDRERSISKPSGVQRVLLLGDSVVEGTNIRELDDTIAGRPEQLYGPGTEVLNFGVSGYCTRAEIELLETKGLAFDPDVVVIVFVENDFDNFNTQLTDLAVRAPHSALSKWLFQRSSLVRALSQRFGWFGITPPEDPFDRTRNAIGGQNVVDGLERLRALAEREGFVALLGVWPHFADGAIIDPHPMDDGSGELVIERLAAGFGIPTFRFSEPFRAHLETLDGASPREAYSTQSDTMHPTPLATGIAARALQQWIDEASSAGSAGSAGSAERAAVVELDAELLALARRKGERQPERFKLYSNVGSELGRQGDYEGAIASYERALEEEQTDGWRAIHHYNIGVAAERAGDLARARSAYTRSIELRPDQTPAKQRLARLDAASEQEPPNADPASPQD